MLSKIWKKRAVAAGFAGAFALVAAMTPAFAEESVASKLMTLVSKMSAEQQAALLTFLTANGGGAAPAAAPAAAAPADGSLIPNPSVALAESVKQLREAAIKGDVDGMIAGVSDKFQQSQIGGKDALKSAIAGLMASGQIQEYAKDTEIAVDKATIKLNKDKAEIYPVDVTGPFGGATLSLTAQLENGTWKVVGAELY